MDNKKLLMKLDNFYLSHLEKHGTDEDVRAYEQIKEMLSSPPNSEVTEEWIIEQAVNTASDYPDVVFPNLIVIFKELLKEAGASITVDKENRGK